MPVYSPAQITAYLRAFLERDVLLRDLWVNGEISNLSTSGAGHSYFTLKDSYSQLQCVMFRSQRGRSFLTEGSAVLAHGFISLYETRGDLRFYVDLIQPEGIGELALKLEQLKVKLEQEGLFDSSRKRALPLFPKKIVVVTSPTGAVWHDIQNVIRRRYPLVELLLAPTQVQGEKASERIAEALTTANQESAVDVIVIARGGGSLEELWPFNEEIVARSIYASSTPVVSGIGHETDFTISDLVADLRAPTPSAAAELIVPDRLQLAANLVSMQYNMKEHALRQVTGWKRAVETSVQRLANRIPDTIFHRQRVDDLIRVISQSFKGSIVLKREHIHGIQQRLQALDPAQVLGRGYAIVQKMDTRHMVSSVSEVRDRDELEVTLQDGKLETRVTHVPDTGTPKKDTHPA